MVRKVKKTKVNIDAEGRLQLPPEIRKELGTNLTLKKTPEGYILSSKRYVANEALRKIINSKHRRTDKPKFATPEEMKSIWNTVEE
jgi:DNA-binding transcriptional regulator/RsmH inhibitor MraZ